MHKEKWYKTWGAEMLPFDSNVVLKTMLYTFDTNATCSHCGKSCYSFEQYCNACEKKGYGINYATAIQYKKEQKHEPIQSHFTN